MKLISGEFFSFNSDRIRTSPDESIFRRYPYAMTPCRQSDDIEPSPTEYKQ